MTNTFMDNLFRGETWSVATDFNHIAHPFDGPNEAQINHEEPSFWDRFGGSVLFILMTPLIVPACLFLYWASKKVEIIDKADANKVEGKIAEFAKTNAAFQHITTQKIERKETATREGTAGEDEQEVIAQPGHAEPETKIFKTSTTTVQGKEALESAESTPDTGSTSTPDKLLGLALVAFGPHRNKAAAVKAIKELKAYDENLFSNEVKSLLLEEAILNDQVDKVELLLSIPKTETEEKAGESKPNLSNRELFNLSSPIPLHKAKNPSMIRKLHGLGVNLGEPLDEKQNTALHLASNRSVAAEILKLNPVIPQINSDGDTPLHTCQSLEILEFLRESSWIKDIEIAKNNHGETPAITLLTRLEHLRDQVPTIEEWNALDEQIAGLKQVVDKFFSQPNFRNKTPIDISPKNHKGYNALHLCAKIGDISLMGAVDKCNTSDAKRPYQLEPYFTITIKGSPYTRFDSALERLHTLSQRLKEEQNPEIAKKLTAEISTLKLMVIHTSSFLSGAGGNNYPIHHLVEIGELELLKQLKINNQDLKKEINRQNGQGETPLVFTLKKLLALNESLGLCEEEKKRFASSIEENDPLSKEEKKELERYESEIKQLQEQIKFQKEFIDFFLRLQIRKGVTTYGIEISNGMHDYFTEKGLKILITDVNLQDNQGKSPLHLCIDIGDLALLSALLSHPNFEINSLAPAEAPVSPTPLSLALEHRNLDLDTLEGLKAFEEVEIKEEEVPQEGTHKKAPPEDKPKEPSEFEKTLQSRIRNQETIASSLLSKTIKAGDPALLERLLKDMSSKFPLEKLDFFAEKNPPLENAFKELRTLKAIVEKEKKVLYPGMWEKGQTQPEILPKYLRMYHEQYKMQLEIINILINYGLTKGNERYSPLFDALKEDNPDWVNKLLDSKNVDVNAVDLHSKKTVLFTALEDLAKLKSIQIALQDALTDAPLETSHHIDGPKSQVEIQEELEELRTKIVKQKEMIDKICDRTPLLDSSLLHLSASLGEYSLLDKILRTEGVDVDTLLSKGGQSYTPLYTAVSQLEYLKEIAADADEGEIFDLGRIIHLLVDHGGDIPSALRNCSPEATELFFNLGSINLTKPQKDGKTPLQAALHHLNGLQSRENDLKDGKGTASVREKLLIRNTTLIQKEKEIILAFINHGALNDDAESKLSAEEKALLEAIRNEK